MVQSQGRREPEPPTAAARPPGVFRTGDKVWIRKRGDRCTAVSKPGQVTGVQSSQTVEVDGIPWHVRNVRHRLEADPVTDGTTSEPGQSSQDEEPPCPVPSVWVPQQLALEAPPPPAPSQPAVETDPSNESNVVTDMKTEMSDGNGSETETEPRRSQRARTVPERFGEPILY